MSEVITSFKNLSAGSQVFALLMLFLGVLCGRVRACNVVLVCHQYDVCENYFCSVYVGGYGGLRESGLCVFRELCTGSFLVVGKRPSGFL